MLNTNETDRRTGGPSGRPVLDGASDADTVVRRRLKTASSPTALRAILRDLHAEARGLAERGAPIYGPRYWSDRADRILELRRILEPSEARPLQVDALRNELDA